MTYVLLLNCALKLVEEVILYYDARSKKHQNNELCECDNSTPHTLTSLLCKPLCRVYNCMYVYSIGTIVSHILYKLFLHNVNYIKI